MENRGIADFIKITDGGNKNSKRSKRLIVEAYIELLKTHSAEKITAKKIVELAGLNRSTFYAHFCNTDEVYKYIEDSAVERLIEYIDEIPPIGRITDPEPLLDCVIKFFEENIEAVRILINANHETKFIDYIREILVEKFMNDTDALKIKDKKKFEITVRFDVGGMAELIRAWFTHKIDIQLKELSASIAQIIRAHMEQLY